MSEPVLKALVRLFALIIDIHNEAVISGKSRDIVKLFLSQHLNSESVARYIELFDEYLFQFHPENLDRDSLRDKKRTSLNAMRILGICEKINEELQQNQKIYVLVRLMDFISSSLEITRKELEFLETVSTAFNITTQEYINIKSFILGNIKEVPEKNRILIADSLTGSGQAEIKHLFIENLSGSIFFLNILSTNTLILRYSGNGDLVLNGQNIFPYQTYVFERGSTIRGSGLRTVYFNDISEVFTREAFRQKVSLTAKGISLRFTDSENGIHNLSFKEESGKMVGIMGGSGVGKTTLVNILSGMTRPQTGTVYINGYDIYDQKDRQHLRGVVGFVSQDDLLIEDLTVYHNLYFNARMCLDNLSVERLEELIDKMLVSLDLNEIRNLKVGSPLEKIISGGQRKRLNIALELIREPTVLFVDEPTSGLSSFDSEAVMNLLKDQAHRGKLVIINIHQPSSDIYKMFDKIMILDKGGYMIFYGNPTEAIIHFKTLAMHVNASEDQCIKCGNVNPDQLLQIVEAKVYNEHGKPTNVRKVSPGEWAEKFRTDKYMDGQKAVPATEDLPPNFYSIPGKWKQSVIYFTRDLLSKLADRQYILITLLGAPLLALILSYYSKNVSGSEYVFSENGNLPAYLFMCVITSTFMGLIISAEEIVKDRKILKRESFLNLSWFSYVNSKILLMFIVSAIQTLSFVIAGNLILEIRGMTLSYWLALFTTSCLANLIGLNISSAFRSVITVYILIPFIIIPQLLFSGVLVNFDNLHRSKGSPVEFVPVIGDLMPARWSFEALVVKQFKDNKFEKVSFSYNLEKSQNNWYASFLIPALHTKVDECIQAGKNQEFRVHSAQNLRILKHHIHELSGISGLIPGKWVNDLNYAGFNKNTGISAKLFLDSLKQRFWQFRKAAFNSADHIANNIGAKKLESLHENYYNYRLADIVLRNPAEQPEQIVETDKRFIQKYEPAYMRPVSKYGRAHFYAPYKKAGNFEIDTYWFNIMTLWIVSLLLYLALNYSLLKKFVIYLESRMSRKT